MMILTINNQINPMKNNNNNNNNPRKSILNQTINYMKSYKIRKINKNKLNR
jgi:hypothetical protein